MHKIPIPRKPTPLIPGQVIPDDGSLAEDPTLDHSEGIASVSSATHLEEMSGGFFLIYQGMPGYGATDDPFYFKDHTNRRSQMECIFDLMQHILYNPHAAISSRMAITGLAWQQLKHWRKVLIDIGFVTAVPRNISKASWRMKYDYRGQTEQTVMEHKLTDAGIIWLKMYRQIIEPFMQRDK